MENRDERPVFRCHYRAQLSGEEGIPEEVRRDCRAEAERLIREERMMTCALYIYGRQLFLYYEALGESFGPEEFMASMAPLLSPWPQKEESARWALMYNVFWHCAPKDAEDWKRIPPREARRGRIAYLRHENMFEYVYHHFAIAREGLLRGDRYMSIALHEDVLFCYFEEPRSADNIKGSDEPSRAVLEWIRSDPDSHFIHLPGSKGENFLLIPAVFDVGQDGD